MDLLRIILSLGAVIGAIAGLAYVAKKAGVAQIGAPAGYRRRLSVAESLFLDPRRRLVILRCDGREHLVLLGPAGETVVEHDIPLADGEPALAAPTESFVATWRRLIKKDERPLPKAA